MGLRSFLILVIMKIDRLTIVVEKVDYTAYLTIRLMCLLIIKMQNINNALILYKNTSTVIIYG